MLTPMIFGWAPRMASAPVLILLLCWVPSAAAAASREAAPLTLNQALAYTLERHPELSQFPYRRRAAEARAMQAGFSPNPEVSLELENVAGSGRFAGAESAEASLVLSQLIELGGKRHRREQVARYRTNLVDREYEQMRWQVLAETVRRFLAVAGAQERQRLSELALRLARESRNVSRRRASAGVDSEASAQRASIAVTRAKLASFHAQQELASARVALAVQWGDTSPRFEAVAANLYRLVPLPAFTDVRETLERSPELARFVTERRLREAELQLAQAQGRQDLRVGIGIKQIQETDDQALTFSLSMPLGVRHRNQGAIAASRAEFEQLTLEEQATRLQLMARLQQLYQQLNVFRTTARLLRSDALPAAKNALKNVMDGYEQGRYSYLELAEARRERLAIERDALQAAVSFYQTLATLEQLTGTSLTGSWRIESDAPVSPDAPTPVTDPEGES